MATIKVMSGGAPKEVFLALTSAFEKQSGHTVSYSFAVMSALRDRLAGGEAADVLVMPTNILDGYEKSGAVRGKGRGVLGLVSVSAVVREGAPKPDIATADALRATLLAAKSIAYSDSGSGTYLSKTLFPKLGIADRIAAKSRKVRGPPSGEPVAAVVARGEAEVGFQQVSELIHVPGVTYVGTIPAELQPGFSFAGAVTTQAREPDAGAALLRFLSSPEAAPVLVKAGLTPPGM